jgi:hypothetical protein
LSRPHFRHIGYCRTAASRRERTSAEADFKGGNFEAGVIKERRGDVARVRKKYFTAPGSGRDERPDAPVVV